ncbi:hypothetical protein K5I29_00620 [Flavobacterium agricola]|uniref:Uncharacterized protein n=1 Tax=Flavobacterium agricola TaxID=2870839 RepID=A0ABY6LYT2_9FLAO|nr:hypothetical protein [Flavobacterium agricola]UYW01488.1 hypothetical protein K5I29_00620 [Flavobacterium agricola]
MKFVNKIAIPFFVFLMMGVIVKNSALCLLYEYQKDLFVEIFCENITKPDMHCDGKCMLAKMQAEQNEQEATHVLKQLQTEMVFNINEPFFVVIPHKNTWVQVIPAPQYYTSLYSYLFTPTFINPPEAV